MLPCIPAGVDFVDQTISSMKISHKKIKKTVSKGNKFYIVAIAVILEQPDVTINLTAFLFALCKHVCREGCEI